MHGLFLREYKFSLNEEGVKLDIKVGESGPLSWWKHKEPLSILFASGGRGPIVTDGSSLQK